MPQNQVSKILLIPARQSQFIKAILCSFAFNLSRFLKQCLFCVMLALFLPIQSENIRNESNICLFGYFGMADFGEEAVG